MSALYPRIRNGNLDFEASSERWQSFAAEHEGERVKLDAIPQVRSLSQNSLYWVYLDAIAANTGNDPEDLHEYFKRNLLPRTIVQVKGRDGTYEIEKLTSTTKLSKAEFSRYMEKIAQLTGVAIPNPEDASYISNYD